MPSRAYLVIRPASLTDRIACGMVCGPPDKEVIRTFAKQESDLMIQFDEAKRRVSVLEVMERCGVNMADYTTRGGVTRGPCPLPGHGAVAVEYRNRQQFVVDAKDRDFELWRCFSGDCGHAGGDSISMARLLLKMDNTHVSRWFEAEFGARLTRSRRRPAQTPPTDEPSECAKSNEASSSKTTMSADIAVATAAGTVFDELKRIEPRPWPVRITETPYLTEQRKLSVETIARYGIGLASKGLMKNRIVFPIFLPHQPDGQLPVAYLGRAIDDAMEPRYLFPKDFPRSNVVYGLREALRDSAADAPLVVTEGCFKVAHLHSALGLTNAIATFGCSLGDGQAEQLIATGRKLIWLWDGDARDKTCKACRQLFGLTHVMPVFLEPGVDPDDLDGEQLRDLLSFAL